MGQVTLSDVLKPEDLTDEQVRRLFVLLRPGQQRPEAA